MANNTNYTEHIINSLPGIFYLFDASGKFLMWNKNFEAVSMYSTGEISKMHPIDFFEDDEKRYIAERIQQVFEKGKSDAKAHFVSKNKTRTPYYFTGHLIQFEGKPCLIGMGVDVSEHEKAEQKLRESEERYRQIVETAQEGIWLIDENSTTTYVNEQMASMLGYSREEMIGKSLFQFMDENEKVDASNNVKRRKRGISEQHEFLFKRKDGSHVWTLLITNPMIKDGAYKGALAMVTDISARKEAERRLKMSEQKFKSLVENSSDIIAVIDEKGNYKFVSPAVNGILGYDPDYFLGKNALDFVHIDDKKIVLNGIEGLLIKGKVENVTYRFLHQNGKWRWLESRGKNLLKDPVINGLVINTRDITDRVELQQKLNLKNKEKQKEITAAIIKTQETERSQLGQELHDNINQVLTTIKLYNEMLRDGLADPEKLVSKSIVHLQNCIDEIRSISKRLSAPTLGDISLSDSIRELAESINLTKRINITYLIEEINKKDVPQELHLAIYRIVQEQLNNIIKYSEAESVVIKINRDHRKLILQIQDNGKGFDPSQKRKGIGITNMKTRAENLNGNFEIKSALGKGCIVTVEFPMSLK